MSCIGLYLDEKEFLFTAKDNSVNLRYNYFVLSGVHLTLVQRIEVNRFAMGC
jgi:hypothetical protein